MIDIKEKIKKVTPGFVKNLYRRLDDFVKWDSHFQKSWSQEGEDMVLSRFFEDSKNIGFFVDIGAHHPCKYSNTYKFYRKGWRGINIDAAPGSMKLFNKKRPLDINLEIAISEKEENLTYYMFNMPALNTFSQEEAEKKNGKNNYQVIDKKKIRTERLETIFDKYLKFNQKIDFLTIDVEGFDFQVLKSNNWSKYIPEYILVEDLESNVEQTLSSDLYKFLVSKGYMLIARTYNTLFFRVK